LVLAGFFKSNRVESDVTFDDDFNWQVP